MREAGRQKSGGKGPSPVMWALAVFVLLAAGLVGFFLARGQQSPTVPVQREQERTATEDAESEDWGAFVKYEGVTYVKKDDLKAVLFLGVDNVTYDTDIVGVGGRADTIMLLLMNTREKTAQILTISRDTMVNVDVYDTTGRRLNSGLLQITMQYAYGDSPKRSSLLMERRVSELIHGININGYLSLTMDGIAPIVDGMGGITLTMDADYTDISPAYTKGTTVEMNGREAEHFVRYRDTDTLGSNGGRMQRQVLFLQALFGQMQSGKVSARKVLDLADGYLFTDLDADSLLDFAGYRLAEENYSLPGEDRQGFNHDEFYVDDEAVKPLLLELFYQPKA